MYHYVPADQQPHERLPVEFDSIYTLGIPSEEEPFEIDTSTVLSFDDRSVIECAAHFSQRRRVVVVSDSTAMTSLAMEHGLLVHSSRDLMERPHIFFGESGKRKNGPKASRYRRAGRLRGK